MSDDQPTRGRNSIQAEIIQLTERLRADAEKNKPERKPAPEPKEKSVAQQHAADTRARKDPNQLTARNELFCQEIAKGTIKYEAARNAGYKGDMKSLSVTAAQMLGKHKIKMRIAELQTLNVLHLRLTRDAHMEALGKLRERATLLGQIGPAIRAEELRGKLSGMYRDEEEQRQVIGERVAKLPVDQQLTLVKAALERIQMITGAHIQMRIDRPQAASVEAPTAPAPTKDPDPVPLVNTHEFDSIEDEPVGVDLRQTKND